MSTKQIVKELQKNNYIFPLVGSTAYRELLNKIEAVLGRRINKNERVLFSKLSDAQHNTKGVGKVRSRNVFLSERDNPNAAKKKELRKEQGRRIKKLHKRVKDANKALKAGKTVTIATNKIVATTTKSRTTTTNINKRTRTDKKA